MHSTDVSSNNQAKLTCRLFVCSCKSVCVYLVTRLLSSLRPGPLLFANGGDVGDTLIQKLNGCRKAH